jgi:hypothetical protein
LVSLGAISKTNMTKKSAITLIVILFSLFSYGQGFEVTVDTLKISVSELIQPDVKIDLTHAVEFQGKYYCFFNEVKSDNTRRDIKFCFILSTNGRVEKKVEVPEEVQNTVYYDLFIKHDTIFVKNYMDGETFYFNDPKSKWIKINEVDDVIFEDDRFYFTFLDFGEWGSTVWCKDKKTKKEYEVSASGTNLNKIDNTYFITSSHRILKIEDPLKLEQSQRDYYYEIVRNKKEHIEGTTSLMGAEIIYNDTTYSYWEQKESKLSLETSFVADNKLYHLCTDSTKTFIAILEKGTMINVQVIGETLSTFNWVNSYRNRIQKDNSQLLKFRTKNMMGLISVKGREISIHYLIMN